MVIKINKKKALICFSFLFILAISLILIKNKLFKETVADFPIKDKVIVIDAGHGGMDGGASSDNVTEKNINLSVAKFLKSYLKQSGACVIMTRENDTSLEKSGSTIRERKRNDMKERKNIIIKSAPDIFISIHQNYFEIEKYKGSQVFYSDNNHLSQKLADSIQNSLKENVDKTNTRQIAPIPKSKILFSDLKVPAVLVECGFLSNKEEAEMLKTEEYREKIAYGIYLGIAQYFCQ